MVFVFQRNGSVSPYTIVPDLATHTVLLIANVSYATSLNKRCKIARTMTTVWLRVVTQQDVNNSEETETLGFY